MVARLKADHPEVRLLLVGSAKFASARYDNEGFARQVEELITSLGVEDNVVWLGERTDIPEILRALDVVLVPSWEEPFGMAVIESMAMEVPVLATAVGGATEVVTPPRNGLLLPPRQPVEWAEAIEGLLERPQLRESIGEAARRRVAEFLTVESYVERVLTGYREVLATPVHRLSPGRRFQSRPRCHVGGLPRMSAHAVVIPTRDRPGKLARCLRALSQAQWGDGFPVYVCDSSTTPEARHEVREVCAQFPFARFRPHRRDGMGAGRNACVAAAQEDILINVDDDVYVEPEAIARLVEAYGSGRHGWRVVGGSVNWHGDWSTPVAMRPIGYGRKVHPGEEPDFLIGALFLYPRALGLALPWNERLRGADDRFIGALWRGHGVELAFAPLSRAHHDEEDNRGGGIYSVDALDDHVYANMFDALIANRDLPRAASWELLGFAAGAKKYFRAWDTAWRYLAAWWRGHRALARDWVELRGMVARSLPAAPHQPREARPVNRPDRSATL